MQRYSYAYDDYVAQRSYACGHGYGHGYWYGYIGMRIGISIGNGMGMAMYEGKMVDGRLLGGRWCGAHIQKAEPWGTLPFVSSLWWLLKTKAFGF